MRGTLVEHAEPAVVELYDSLDEPFAEHAQPDHVTGSAVVVGPRGVCLLLHKRAGRWLQPGGHVEGGEHPADAALREAREETGLPVRHPGAAPVLVAVDVHPAPKASCGRHLDLRYLLVVDGDPDPAPPPGESQSVRWFPLEEACGAAEADGDVALARTLRAGWAAAQSLDGSR